MRQQIPQVTTAKLKDLFPTQITVGRMEVKTKREQWGRLKKKEREELLKTHYFPAVIGPNGNLYIIDHHHLGLALIEENVGTVGLIIQKDLSWLKSDVFWRVMEFFKWVHPFDEEGKRCEFSKIPKDLTLMVDDPYRSLAGVLRKVGGYSKDSTTYSEFLWADFLRSKIPRNQVEKNFDMALEKSKRLCVTKEASYLPGWVGNEIEMSTPKEKKK